MKTKLWLMLFAAALLVAVSFSPGRAQSYQNAEEENRLEFDAEDEAELPSILMTAVEYESLSTVLELLRQSGLDKELEGEGPITLFAPYDSAFLQLSPGQMEKLRNDKKYLISVLSRHIVTADRIVFGDKPEMRKITSLNGEVINAEVTEEAVRVEQAWIIDEEIDCSNGVIHVIDAVLLPLEGKQKD